MPQWKQFSGNWTVTQAAQAKGAGTWPTLPGAPTIGTPTAANQAISVAFTAPANPGYPTTLTYEVTSSPGGFTATGSASPITVTGLTNGTEYTFTVTATNDTGTGPASAASVAIAPVLQGYLYAWGANSRGELGQNNRINTSSPVQIGTDQWLTASAGNYSTAAIRNDNTLWTWGENNFGVLGLDDLIDRSSPTQVGGLSDWKTLSVTSLSTPTFHATKTDGTLWGWGDNFTYGQIGDGTTVRKSSPVQIGALTNWSQVSSGFYSVGAIKTNGTLWTWGRNNSGGLGQNFSTSTSVLSPVQVGSLTNWKQLSMSLRNGHAVKTDGTLWGWGGNGSGQLGDNTTVYKSSPVQIGALTTWLQVSTSNYNTFAIKNDGTYWVWGSATFGMLGNNTGTGAASYSSPIQLGALTSWAIADSGKDTTAGGIKTDGTLWRWGNNGGGQIGDSNPTNVDRSSPVQIGSEVDWLEVHGKTNTVVSLKGS